MRGAAVDMRGAADAAACRASAGSLEPWKKMGKWQRPTNEIPIKK
jgi:hypothetical protein